LEKPKDEEGAGIILEKRDRVREFCLNAELHVTFRNILHTVKLRHGTDGFTTPPKEGGFFSPKNSETSSAGFEPANLGTKGQHATYRPPKPLTKSILYD